MTVPSVTEVRLHVLETFNALLREVDGKFGHVESEHHAIEDTADFIDAMNKTVQVFMNRYQRKALAEAKAAEDAKPS